MSQHALLMKQLQEICTDLQIHDADSFTFRSDRPHDVVSTPEPAPDGGATGTQSGAAVPALTPLTKHLADELYRKCYVRHYPLVGDQDSDTVRDNKLTELFQQANHSKDGWDPGWRIYQTCPDGRVFVQKGERSCAALPGAYSTYKWPGVKPQSGDLVSVRLFADSTDAQVGFFIAFGRTLSDQFDEIALVRFYFNIKAHAAVSLMGALTTLLNRYLIPFRFKSLVDAGAYTRADAAVLYVARRYYHLVAPLVIELSGTLQDGLRDGTPLFSKTLVPGIGMADDPATAESFGQHRCRLVAEAMVAAWEAGTQAVEARLDAIQQRFTTAGIQLALPYLNPKSINIFDQPIFLQENQW